MKEIQFQPIQGFTCLSPLIAKYGCLSVTEGPYNPQPSVHEDNRKGILHPIWSSAICPPRQTWPCRSGSSLCSVLLLGRSQAFQCFWITSEHQNHLAINCAGCVFPGFRLSITVLPQKMRLKPFSFWIPWTSVQIFTTSSGLGSKIQTLHYSIYTLITSPLLFSLASLTPMLVCKQIPVHVCGLHSAVSQIISLVIHFSSSKNLSNWKIKTRKRLLCLSSPFSETISTEERA